MLKCSLRVGHDIIRVGVVFSPTTISSIGSDVIITLIWMCFFIKNLGSTISLAKGEVVHAICSNISTSTNIQFACTLSWG